MEYIDFDLLIERHGRKYRARVLRSPAGEAQNEFNLPFNDRDIELFLLKVGRPRGRGRRIDSSEMSAIKNFGGRLFQAVFDGEVSNCLSGSLEEAQRRGLGLRIRLRLTEVLKLIDLPWEYLYNPSLNQFFALSNTSPIIRYLDLPAHILPLSVKGPINVLAMISSPTDYPPLDVKRELEKLDAALSRLVPQGIVKLEYLEEATLDALRKCLRRAHYHIFHFIGHGSFNKQADDGIVVMEDENQKGRLVSGQDLGRLLRDARTLRLALLNTCEGARNSRVDPFAGTAQSLLQQGIPAVIAMQFEVTDHAAIKFAQEFYDVLAEGFPVDTALTEARKALQTGGNDTEWGTPVLYMRSSDGKIFDIAPARSEAAENNQGGGGVVASDEMSHHLFETHMQLSLLFYLKELPAVHQGLSIKELCEYLGIARRKDVIAALSNLVTAGLVNKIKKKHNAFWQISDKGREILQKFAGLIRTKIITSGK
jgi:hypothetical protein